MVINNNYDVYTDDADLVFLFPLVDTFAGW